MLIHFYGVLKIMDFPQAQCNTKAIGNVGEMIAKRYLEKRGLVCLYEQYRTTFGEVDLIMRDKDEIVFVEVRYRRETDFGEPHETVTPKKQRKLIRMAQAFQQRFSWASSYYLRIDVVGIFGNQLNHKITWIPNAVVVK